jgi:hypothetical protein
MAQYAIHGYEVEALDYVLKPITFQDFSLKMKKAMRYIKRDAKQQIILNTPAGKVPIKLSDVYYIEVIRHSLVYHTKAGVHETRGVMREQEKTLADLNFVRCSQSYLVNLAYVKAIRGNDVVVNDEMLPISRNKKNEFMEAFTRYVGGCKWKLQYFWPKQLVSLLILWVWACMYPNIVVVHMGGNQISIWVVCVNVAWYLLLVVMTGMSIYILAIC